MTGGFRLGENAHLRPLPCLQHVLLWERRNNTVPPFGETVQQVFSRISALRDSLDGPQVCLLRYVVCQIITHISFSSIALI